MFCQKQKVWNEKKINKTIMMTTRVFSIKHYFLNFLNTFKEFSADSSIKQGQKLVWMRHGANSYTSLHTILRFLQVFDCNETPERTYQNHNQLVKVPFHQILVPATNYKVAEMKNPFSVHMHWYNCSLFMEANEQFNVLNSEAGQSCSLVKKPADKMETFSIRSLKGI